MLDSRQIGFERVFWGPAVRALSVVVREYRAALDARTSMPPRDGSRRVGIRTDQPASGHLLQYVLAVVDRNRSAVMGDASL